MSGQHEMPTASVVRSSQATPARRRGHLCTASPRQSSTYRRPIRVQTNGATSVRDFLLDDCGTRRVYRRAKHVHLQSEGLVVPKLLRFIANELHSDMLMSPG